MNAVMLECSEIIPSKIICIGRNYVGHINELNNSTPTEPVIFIKPNSAISNEILFDPENTIHYEGEITFLVHSGELYGVGFGLDLTKRDIQDNLKKNGLPWERAKSFNNSAVFSHFAILKTEISCLRMELQINNILVQNATYDLMRYKPEIILKEVKSFLTLEDGDLIMTGTPKGVGELRIGDEYLSRIYNNSELLLEHSWVVK